MNLALPDLDPQYLYKCAALLLKCRKYSFARDLYRAILNKDVKNPEALKGYGICFYSEGNLAAAKRCFAGLRALGEKDLAEFWLQLLSYQEDPTHQAIEKVKALPLLSRILATEEVHLPEEVKKALEIEKA